MAAELLTALLSFQADAPELQQRREYDKQATEFVKSVSNLNGATFLKGADTPQDVLAVLDPTANSIAYAFTLRYRVAAALEKRNLDPLRPGSALWSQLVQFLETFDPVQMRYAGAEYRKLVEYVEQVARAMDTPALAIAPMRSAMLRLDPTTGTFTLTHLRFVQLCMETRSYAAAVPILDNYIHSFPSLIPYLVREGQEHSVPAADTATSGEFIHVKSGHTDKVGLADVQEYYVLAAMAYLGVRQFKHALQLLEHALVVPAPHAANGLLLEAYKKWVLVACLVPSKTERTLPRTASNNAMKQVRLAAKAYEAVAEAFGQLGNLAKLKAQVAAGSSTWAEDGNAGLVDEVVAHQHRSYVSRLSRTFSAMAVSSIARNLGGDADELAAFIDGLICDGQLNARLERRPAGDGAAVVRFCLDPSQGPLGKTEKQQQALLAEHTRRTQTLAGHVSEADYRLSVSREYVEHLRRQAKRMGAAGPGEAMDVAWDGEDEDMMGDVR